MPGRTPAVPVPYAAPSAAPAAPVKVEEYRRSYEGPLDAVEQYYDSGVRSAFQAQQSLLGALDGQWTVASLEGAPLFTLLLNDEGLGSDVNGAWRDLRSPRAVGASGLLESVERDGPKVVMRFKVEGRPGVTVLRLSQGVDGRWRGDLDDAGVHQAVVMSRS